MIVIGADTHKATHTCAAVDGATGQLAGELTAAVSAAPASPIRSTPWRSPGPLCARGRSPCRSPTWTRERCRSSSCSTTARTSSRPAQRISSGCAGTFTTSGPSWSCRAAELEAEIAALVDERAPQLLELKGCGALTAAKLIGETAGAARFASDAKFARLAGVAPVPASSGKHVRHRLDRGGNRQLNCALHRIAVCQGRTHPPAREFLERKQAEGKSRREALRCLKRHLARRVWKLLIASEIDQSQSNPVDPQRRSLTPGIAAVA